MQKLGIQVTSFTRKSRKYSSYKGKVGTIAPNRIRRRFRTHIPHQKITTDTLDVIYKNRVKIMQRMNSAICKGIERDTSLLFYDVTNFYFEIGDPGPDVDD